MRNLLTVILALSATAACAQPGGQFGFDFLDVPAHARLAALGGVNVSLADRDINFFQNNPALAGDTLGGAASAGFQFYTGDISHALISYCHDFGRPGQVMFGIQHMDYGTMRGFDASGSATADFRAGETAVVIGRSHGIGNFRLGATLKGVFSGIAGYRASALLMDLGGIFRHPEKDMTAGLVIKNAGFVLSDFRGDQATRLPFDVQAGATLKPEHMPVRLSVTAYHLTRKKLLQEDAPGSETRIPVIRKILSHLNMGAEILLHRNFNVLVGYNYLVHQSLRLPESGGSAGLSVGFSLLVKPVEVVFSRSSYVTGNAGYTFTLSTNTNNLLKRR